MSGTKPLVAMARIGYAARGLVFLVVGGFALLAALGSGQRPQGIRDALQRLFEQPFGGFLLWTVAAGLLCFAGWRVLQSMFDADGHGRSPYGLMRRGIFGASALFYLALAAATARITLGARGATEQQSARDWTAWLMVKPLGRAAITAIALGFIVVALGLLVKVIRAPYQRRLQARLFTRESAIALGSFGILTRAIVFAMIGAFLGFAAYDADSNQVQGLSGILHTLQQQRYGGWLLALAGLGLIAFGVFEFIEALARRVHAPRWPGL